MKILIIGVGGIGSWLIDEVCDCIDQEQISPDTQLFIADDDVVEMKNMKYQNFTPDDMGKPKAETLADRLVLYGVEPIKKRIEKDTQLNGYDLIILCADNNAVRELVFRYCHKTGKDFIDLRAEGRRVYAGQKTTLKEDLSTLNLADRENGSCQLRVDLERGYIQKGNKIIAMIGMQLLLNHIRREATSPRMVLKI